MKHERITRKTIGGAETAPIKTTFLELIQETGPNSLKTTTT